MATSDRYLTLILIPDARAPYRRVRVPVRLVRWGLRAAVALGFVAVASLAHYAWLNRQFTEMEALRLENASLNEQVHEYRVTLGSVAGQISTLQRTVTKLGIVSGVEQDLPTIDGVAGGLGGASWADVAPPAGDPTLARESFSRHLEGLAERSGRIERFYADQTELLSRTPSIWPVRGYLSSAYGRRQDPFTQQRDYHPGIDISAPRGSEVKAPADGVVVSVGRRPAYGKAIVIDHGFDVVTRYGHLDGYNVRPGQRVRRGDVIGFVGSTGRSSGPHLHYEVWARGKLQNPIHYILEEYRSFG
jgi:murein DD-endopeptidase MepM/ murein hydrolase activator NlpD